MKHVRAGDEPDEQLQGEPSIADTLDIEESIMGISPIFVQGPGSCVMGGLDSEVMDDRDSHVRMGLEVEGEDGGADEEDRDNTDTLKKIIHLPDKLFYLPLQWMKSTAHQKYSRFWASVSSTSLQFLGKIYPLSLFILMQATLFLQILT